MSLFAIGDLHLHFQSELKAPGQLHEPVWKKHDVKFRQNCEKLIKPDDTLVLVGDHSWGKKLPECSKDLEYICDAIWHHDDKASMDSLFAEVLKDADVIDHCLTDPTKEIKGKERSRYEKLRREFTLREAAE